MQAEEEIKAVEEEEEEDNASRAESVGDYDSMMATQMGMSGCRRGK